MNQKASRIRSVMFKLLDEAGKIAIVTNILIDDETYTWNQPESIEIFN